MERFFYAVFLACLIGFGYSVPSASAGEFHLKNCTPKRAFVCAYNSNDQSLAAASDAAGLHSGKQKGFKCSTKRCKVFIGFSKHDVGSVLGGDIALASLIAIPGSSVVAGGIYMSELASSAAADEILVTSASGPAGAAVLGVAVAAVAIDAGAETNAVCKRIISKVKHSKHSKAAKDSSINGHNHIAFLRDDDDQVLLRVQRGNECP
ncbi:MAG: hypothetical protein R3261_00355 [Alphaproteobacteria bacterium]|nr:hypothetical protein [Alphaproteobacteria bacterium]